MKYSPVTIQKDAFTFCRYSVAILLWIAFVFKLTPIIWVTFVIFVLSAILGVSKAPMIILYSYTVGKIFSSRPKIVVDIHDIRFVHTLAAIINGLVLFFVILKMYFLVWPLLLVFTLLKSASAVGYCPASKLRNCVLGGNGSCCSVSKIINSKKSC